ncbi:MAG TPA: GNAT family N-acetyltransferase, partial [Pseudolysinimonas sp.]|nr:GNAT family N-acetyltransferase [Pseudolysinimonas sp.]
RMTIRDARPADLGAILDIHNHAIRTSLAIWLDEPVDLADRAAWLAEHQAAGHPVLVAEVDGAVVGYASFSAWRARWGYRHTVEDSVYIAESHQRRGLGRAMVADLVGRARAAGMHTMIADIEAGNVASIALHESLGFRREGTIGEVGTKHGRWLDLAILRLPLEQGSPP